MRIAQCAPADASVPARFHDGTERVARTAASQTACTVVSYERMASIPVGSWHDRDQAVPSRRLNAEPRPPKALESIAALISCRRGQKIYGERDRVEHWYRVAAGVAKKYALLADGRQQIVEFLLPGDFFGFGASDEHHFTVEVVAKDTVLARYLRRDVEKLAECDPHLGKLLREIAFEAVARSQTRMLTLVRMRAPQKVGAFLLEMAERLAAGPAEAVALPMSRYDIADYLGLSAEAVSRSLTKLKGRGVIRLTTTRQVRILDREALERE